MNSSSSMKMVVAFAAGMLLALGGAVAYVKLSDPTPSHPVAAAVAQPAPTAPATLPDAGLNQPGSSAVASTAAQSEPEPKRQALSERRPRPELRARSHEHSQSATPLAAGAIKQADSSPQLMAQNAPSAGAAPAANPYTLPPSSPQNVPPPRPAVQEPTSQPQAVTPPPVPRTVTLDAGSSIVVRLVQAVSTKTMNDGDTFRASLQLPIVKEGAVIAERGSSVVGRIVSSQRAGRVKGRSDLQLAITEINTTDGQRVAIETAALDKQGKDGKMGDAAKVGGGAALGAIIGAIAGGGKGAAIGAGAGGAAGTGDVLLTRGKDVEIPSETELTFRLSKPVVITEQLH